MDPKAIVLGMAIGAGIGGGGATLAAAGDAITKLRELAPDIATHRVDLFTNEDGSVSASIHQHGVLTEEAKAAGLERPSWVVPATCRADSIAVVVAACVVDDKGIPAAFKASR